MNTLIIANTQVRQDSEGRYSLNDLHNASGGAAKHKPALWLRSNHDLLDEAVNSTDLYPLNTVTGRNGGTFVCKELVYAYAMWISPAFQMKVIRAYDAMQTTAPMTQVQMLVAQAQAMVELEQRQLKQARVLEELECQQEQVIVELDVLREKLSGNGVPTGYLTRSQLRRTTDCHGLSDMMLNEVFRIYDVPSTAFTYHAMNGALVFSTAYLAEAAFEAIGEFCSEAYQVSPKRWAHPATARRFKFLP